MSKQIYMATKETTKNEPKSRNVFGIRGLQRDPVTNRIMIGDDGKPINYKGVESELYGDGSDLEEFEYWIIRLTKAERASTNPEKRGKEVYVTQVKVLEKFGHDRRCSQHNADDFNKQVDWTLPGTPNDIRLLLKKGTVKEGQLLKADCKHEAYNNSGATNFILKIEFKPEEVTNA